VGPLAGPKWRGGNVGNTKSPTVSGRALRGFLRGNWEVPHSVFLIYLIYLIYLGDLVYLDYVQTVYIICDGHH
jgi:hypothetical protein